MNHNKTEQIKVHDNPPELIKHSKKKLDKTN